MSELTDVLHWLRPSNWAGVELGKAAQTLDVITELQAENERLREALRQIITHQSLLTELADEKSQFAEHLEQASRIVQSWPVWKQSVLGNIDPREIHQPETTTPARQSSTGESELSDEIERLRNL
jgi:FtsZ-binding cell division protein ZapB